MSTVNRARIPGALWATPATASSVTTQIAFHKIKPLVGHELTRVHAPLSHLFSPLRDPLRLATVLPPLLRPLYLYKNIGKPILLDRHLLVHLESQFSFPTPPLTDARAPVDLPIPACATPHVFPLPPMPSPATGTTSAGVECRIPVFLLRRFFSGHAPRAPLTHPVASPDVVATSLSQHMTYHYSAIAPHSIAPTAAQLLVVLDLAFRSFESTLLAWLSRVMYTHLPDDLNAMPAETHCNRHPGSDPGTYSLPKFFRDRTWNAYPLYREDVATPPIPSWLWLDMYDLAIQPGPRQRSFWYNVTIPPAILALDRDTFYQGDWLFHLDGGYWLWFIGMWRCHVAELCENAFGLASIWRHGAGTDLYTHFVECSPGYWANDDANWVSYTLTLFRDTHLPYLAAADADAHNGVYPTAFASDVAIIHGHRVFPNHEYPSCINVNCFEEHPDASYFLPECEFRYEQGLKKHELNLRVSIIYLLFSKVMNQRCQIRAYHSHLVDAARELPEFRRLLVNIVHTMMLGNAPLCRNRLEWAARLRVTTSFVASEDTAFLSEFYHVILAHRHMIMFLVREWQMHVVRLDPVLSAALDEDSYWGRFRALCHTALGDCRREMDLQAQFLLDKHQPFAWNEMQTTHVHPKTPVQNEIVEYGLFERYHKASLKVARKLRKGHLLALLDMKMTSAEASFQPPNGGAPILLFGEPGRGLTRHQFHFVCWCVATRSTSHVLDPRVLLSLGIRPSTVAVLTSWVQDYYEKDIPDHRFVTRLTILWKDDVRDYLIFRHFVDLVREYRQNTESYLSAEQTARQLMVLRRRDHVEDVAPTPPGIAMMYYCPGCEHWASPEVHPPDWYTVFCADHSVSTNSFTVAAQDQPGVQRMFEERRHVRSTKGGSVYYCPFDGNSYCVRAQYPKLGYGPSGLYARMEELADEPSTTPDLHDPVSGFQEHATAVHDNIKTLAAHIIATPTGARRRTRMGEGDGMHDPRLRSHLDWVRGRLLQQTGRPDHPKLQRILQRTFGDHPDRPDRPDHPVDPDHSSPHKPRACLPSLRGVHAKQRKGARDRFKVWMRGVLAPYARNLATGPLEAEPVGGQRGGTEGTPVAADYTGKSTSKGCRTPIQVINMAGMRIKRKGVYNQLCAVCGSRCRSDSGHLTTYGYTCMQEQSNGFAYTHPVWYHPYLQQGRNGTLTRFAMQLGILQLPMDTMELGAYNFGMSDGLRTITNNGDRRILEQLYDRFYPRQLQPSNLRPPCALCESAAAVGVILVLDENYRIRYLTLCAAHKSSMVFNVRRPMNIVLLHDVMYAATHQKMYWMTDRLDGTAGIEETLMSQVCMEMRTRAATMSRSSSAVYDPVYDSVGGEGNLQLNEDGRSTYTDLRSLSHTQRGHILEKKRRCQSRLRIRLARSPGMAMAMEASTAVGMAVASVVDSIDAESQTSGHGIRTGRSATKSQNPSFILPYWMEQHETSFSFTRDLRT